MPGPKTRRSHRRSMGTPADDSDVKEMELFQKLATAIGDSLDVVFDMQKRERNELITVLGLESSDDKLESVRHELEAEVAVDDKIQASANKVKTNENEGDAMDNNSNTNPEVDGMEEELKVLAIKKRTNETGGKRKMTIETSNESGKKFLKTENGYSFKDGHDEKKEECNAPSEDIHESIGVDIESDKEESISLLESASRLNKSRVMKTDCKKLSSTPVVRKEARVSNEKSSPRFSKIKEQNEEKCDDMPSNIQVSDANIEEEDMDDKNSGNILKEKLSDVNSLLISKLNLPPLDIKRLKNIVNTKVGQPKLVLSQDSLPFIKDRSFVDCNNVKTLQSGSESSENLFKYFKAVKDTQSKGLIHSASGNTLSWAKLLLKKNIRGKTMKSGIRIKFVNEKKVSPEKKIYDSSDDFEEDICHKNNKTGLSEDEQLHVQTKSSQDQPSLSKSKSLELLGNSSTRKNQINMKRLSLSKGKRRLELGSPEKVSKSKSEVSSNRETSTDDPAVKSDGLNEGFQSSLTNGANNSHPWLFVSDEDDSFIEVASSPSRKKNTPIKPKDSIKKYASPAEESGSPVVTNNKSSAPSGTCPLCGVEMTIRKLVKHSAVCQGPDQGPVLRNSGGRERRKL